MTDNKTEQNKAGVRQAGSEIKAKSKPQDQQAPSEQNEQKKSGYFRWQGLVGFFAVLSLIIGVMVIYASDLIKLGIEEGGSHYWGAEVNVADVEVTWSPFKIAVNGFEVTDPAAPSQNIVAFEQARVSMDLWQSIVGKTLIHSVDIKQVYLNKARQYPGKVTIKPDTGKGTEEDTSMLEDTMAALPTVEELLARSDLKTAKAGVRLLQTYKTEKAAIKALATKLPDQAKIAEYQRLIKAISDTDTSSPQALIKATEDLTKLKEQFEADKVLLKAAKKQLKSSKENISVVLKDVKDAPKQDWAMLSEQYQLNEGGAQNFTALIFGQQAKVYYQQASELFEMIKPMLDKLNKSDSAPPVVVNLEKGRFVHFELENPMPDWLVEKTHISMNLDQGGFVIEIEELNAQHWIRNKPTKLTVKSTDLLGMGALALNADVFMQQKAGLRIKSDWDVQGLTFKQLPITDSKNFKLVLAQTKLDVKGSAAYANQKLENNNHLAFSDSVFEGSADSSIGQAVVDILSQMNTLSVDIGASGDVASPDLSIRSALDKQLMSAIKKRAKVELEKFKGKAMKAMQQKVAEQINANVGGEQDLLAYDGDFSQLDKQLEELLKTKLADKVTDSLKEKLKKKLGDWF
ncbi:MAG: TIGR03545 family protein [Algicola sp.]|nr:TIGR03545 family protein [Algicola sp.]